MLNKIIEQQKQINQAHKAKYPEAMLLENITPSKISFLKALQAKKHSYILECKQSSPSKGIINTKYDLKTLAQTYNPFASAISVLTNQPFFNGSLTHLKTVRHASDLPLLCKDFIFTPHQILLARYFGADAVLLMLSVLSDETYRSCQQMARRLNLSILTEVHSELECQRALALDAEIIGINQRNLHNLSIDRELIFNLSSKLPKDKLIIAESGIRDHHDIQLLKPYVNGFLIGTALNSSDAPDLTLRSLIFGQVKICGLTTKDSAIAAYQHGAVFGGLNFIPVSKRFITLEQANTIRQSAPLQYVGVFADTPIEKILDTVNFLELSAVQLHGHENAAYINQLRRLLRPDCKIFQAINGNARLPLKLPDSVDKLVVDNQVNDQLGGTNQRFDWSKLKNSPILKHMFLAGGLQVGNITEAMDIGTFGLDINSGVETEPGNKDPQKMAQLFALIREY